MKSVFGFALISTFALLAACDGASPGENTSAAANASAVSNTAAPAPDPKSHVEGAPCIPLDAAQWSAWIDNMPGTEGPTLHVKGMGVVYRKDWQVTLAPGPLDKNLPATQHIQITTISSGAWHPNDPPIDVPVEVTMPAPKEKLGAVVVDCRTGLELVRITDIKTAS